VTPVTMVTPPELSFVRVDMATARRTEEDMLEASMVETMQMELSPMPSSVSVMGQTEEGTSEMSAEDVAAGQTFVPAPPTSATTG
jgi:hypothetical protein